MVFAMIALLLCLSGCGNAAATYTSYVQAVMDCTYYGQTSEYIRLTGVSEAEAAAIHEMQVQHTAELICSRMTVQTDSISDKTMEGYCALAETLLGQVQFSVEPAVKSDDMFQVRVISEPLVFWETALPDVEQLYADHFAERFALAEGNPKRLARLEGEWGKKVLDILNSYAVEIGHREQVSTLVYIAPNQDGRYAVPDWNWVQLDQLLLAVTSDVKGE